MAWDNQLFFLVNRLAEFSWIRTVAPAITWLGDWRFISFVLLFFLILNLKSRFLKPRIRAVMLMVVAISVLHSSLKPLFNIPRPYLALGSDVVSYYGEHMWSDSSGATPISRLCPGWNGSCVRDTRPVDPSFPSGHALLVFGFVGLLWSHRKLRWLVLSLAVLVGFSRIILGYHYPLDVIAGGLLGFMIGYLGQRYFGPLDRPKMVDHTV